MRIEVVLRSPDAGDYVILHTKCLRIGEVIETASGLWQVTKEQIPTHVGVFARYICVPA